MDMQARIRALYPGVDARSNATRNRLYKIDGFLKKDPDTTTDAEIQAAAQAEQGEVAAEPPAPEPPEVLDPETAAQEVEKRALALQTQQAEPVLVKTAEDYERASLGFAKIKKMISDNEKDRVALTGPILKVKKNIDDRFKAAEKILQVELQRYELPMVAFKTAEREALRKQEADLAESKRKAEVEAQRIKDEAALALETAALAVEQAEDPFLAAILADDLEDAKAEVRSAHVQAVALVEHVPVPANYVAPVTAIGSRASFPWVIEVTDPERVDRQHCSPDPVKLTALARRLKAENDDINQINPELFPGLKITEQTRIGGR